MISSLSISNYALIKQLDLAPDTGLNIITGETGSGKSIMLGAVGLLLGNRCDAKSLLDKEKKCVVEGEFALGKLNLEALFEELNIDYEAQTIIRREINSKGKSRAFINDAPVTLDVMKSVGRKLVDIHSQNESIELGNKVAKIKILDDFSQSVQALSKFQSDFNDYSHRSKKLSEFIDQEQTSKSDIEHKKFLLEELTLANLQNNEQKSLEDDLNVLEHAGEIKLKLSQVTAEFEIADLSLNDKLREGSNTLRNIANFSKDLEALADRFKSATEEIIDIVRDLVLVQEGVNHNPARMEEASTRLDLIYKLQQKHKVSSIDDLLLIQSKLESEAESVENLTQEIEEKKTATEEAKRLMIKSAEFLSKKRRTYIDSFSIELNALLAGVGMPDGHIELVYKRVEPWKMGIDDIEILFSANKGINAEPVGNIASGGEFSRLMFCIKFLLADKTEMPTVVFDEIDTGVSGEVAMKMANMMVKMSKSHQIIAISHLPQIAARGEAHYFVYKNNESAKTESMIRKLDKLGRLEEIAKMIGGESPSETARSSARELIEMK